MVKWYVDSDFVLTGKESEKNHHNKEPINIDCENKEVSGPAPDKLDSVDDEVDEFSSITDLALEKDLTASVTFKIEEITSILDQSFGSPPSDGCGEYDNLIFPQANVVALEEKDITNKIFSNEKKGKIISDTSEKTLKKNDSFLGSKEQDLNNDRPSKTFTEESAPPIPPKTFDKSFCANLTDAPPICRRSSTSTACQDPSKRRALIDLLDFDVNELFESLAKNRPPSPSIPKPFPKSINDNSDQIKHNIVASEKKNNVSKSHDDLLESSPFTNESKTLPTDLQWISNINEEENVPLRKGRSSNTPSTTGKSKSLQCENSVNILHKPALTPKRHTKPSVLNNSETDRPKRLPNVRISNPSFDNLSSPNNCFNPVSSPPVSTETDIHNILQNRNLLLDSLLRTLSSDAWQLESTTNSGCQWSSQVHNSPIPVHANPEECQVEFKSLIEVLESNLNDVPTQRDNKRSSIKNSPRKVGPKPVPPPKLFLSKLRDRDLKKQTQAKTRSWKHVVSKLI